MNQFNRIRNSINLALINKDEINKAEKKVLSEEKKIFNKLSTTQKILYTQNMIKSAFTEDDLKILFND